MEKTFTHGGREFSVTEEIKMEAASALDFSRRGFETSFFMAVSIPVGRQRRTYAGLFLKEVGGEYVSAT